MWACMWVIGDAPAEDPVTRDVGAKIDVGGHLQKLRTARPDIAANATPKLHTTLLGCT